MPACTFCEVIAGERPAHFVIDRGPIRAFLDHRPLFPGHTIVVPLEHVEHLNALPDELELPFWHAVRAVSRAEVAALGADGTFAATNTVVSQSVPHLHAHVVPRRRKDGLRGFFWPRTKYASEEEAASVADLLRDAVIL
ncbi:MAG TPA: HIT family protein [Acidimicrobiia bacterium]